MSPEVPRPLRLPRRIRAAAVVCLILSAVTSFGAVKQTAGLFQLEEIKEAPMPKESPFGAAADPELFRRLQLTMVSALEPMREPRALVLITLTLACMFSFAAAGHMLQPRGLPREGIRRLLGGTAITAAVLRTIDGAQLTVVARRASATIAELVAARPEVKSPAEAAQLKELAEMVLPATTMLQTAVVAGLFALLGQYFRSERVREAVLAIDGPPTEE